MRRIWLVVKAMVVVAVLFATWIYTGEYSFFTILEDSFMGWWYPGLIAILFFQIHRDYGKPVTAMAADSAPN